MNSEAQKRICAITTARLVIRPFKLNDLNDLVGIHSNPEVVRFLYWETRSKEEMADVLKKRMAALNPPQPGSTLVLAVVLQETHRVIGEVSLAYRSGEHLQGEIGFVFNPNFQGKGYAKEATQAVLELGFEKLKLHRLSGHCDARNISSFKLMESLGMRREAHFIQNEKFKGEWSDELVYALLREEWLARTA